jgi:hypothetical protein
LLMLVLNRALFRSTVYPVLAVNVATVGMNFFEKCLFKLILLYTKDNKKTQKPIKI